MTVSYALDISKTLNENVSAITRACFREMWVFAEAGSVNIQHTLVLSYNDWDLLARQRNVFDVTGLQMIKASLPDYHIRLEGSHDAEAVERDARTWDDHPDHRVARELHETFIRSRLVHELRVRIPPGGLPPDPWRASPPRRRWWRFWK
jgi:hypothetical protein